MPRTIVVQPWTPTEDLLVLFAPCTDVRIAEILGPPRTRKTVKMRRYVLTHALQRRKPIRRDMLASRAGRRWTADEDAKVLDPTSGPDALLAANSGRSEASLRDRRYLLKQRSVQVASS